MTDTAWMVRKRISPLSGSSSPGCSIGPPSWWRVTPTSARVERSVYRRAGDDARPPGCSPPAGPGPFREAGPRPRVHDRSGSDPGASGGGHPEPHVVQVGQVMGIRVDGDEDPQLTRPAGVDVAEVQARRRGADLDGLAVGAGHREDAIQVDVVGLALPEQTARGMDEDLDVGVLEGTADARRHLGAGLLEAGVDGGQGHLHLGVEVAPEVADLDQGRETPAQGSLDLSGILAELGGDPGEPDRAVDLLLGRPRHPAAALVEDAVLVHLQLFPDGHLADAHVVRLRAGEV